MKLTEEEHAKVLAALEESVDLVEHTYLNDWRHGIPTRAKQLAGMREGVELHKEAIAIMRKEPEGLVSVPLKPTTAMLRPFYECPPDELELAWDAMLAISGVLEKAR